MSPLDALTLLAYVALSMDVIFQISRVLKTKSSHDLSLIGLAIRFIAIFILLTKFVTLRELPLILGQGLLTATFALYIVLAIHYSRSRRYK